MAIGGASCLDETETLRRALQKDQRHRSTQHRRHAMLTMSPIHAKSPRRGSVRHQHQCTRRVDSGTGLQPVQAKTMKTLAQGQRGVLRNQLMAWAKSPLGRGDDLPLSKLAAHGKSILTECDADGGERRPLPTAYSWCPTSPAGTHAWRVHPGVEHEHRTDARAARDDGRVGVDGGQRLRLFAPQRLDDRRLPRTRQVDRRAVGWRVSPRGRRLTGCGRQAPSRAGDGIRPRRPT